MNGTVRWLGMARAPLLLTLGYVFASCVFPSCMAQTPNEPVSPTLATAGSSGEAPPPVEEPIATSETPTPQSGCECGPMVTPAPADCVRERWFCNAQGSCRCEEAVTAPEPDAPEPAPAISREQNAEPVGCICLGTTVTPPQGGCALADWFCNASGLCRCRH